MELNVTDLIIAGIISVSAFLGVKRGLVKEIFSLLTWACAALLCIKHSNYAYKFLSNYINDTVVLTAASYSSIFLFVLILGSLISIFLTKIVSFSGMGITNRLTGSIFGIARGLIIVSIMILLINTSPFSHNKYWEKSSLVPKFKPIINIAANYPKIFDHKYL